MRRALASPELIVVVVLALVIAALSASTRRSSADIELTAGAGGSLTLSNSKEGSAILALGGMRPGDFVDGTVTIGNTGTIPGDLTLSTSNLVDAPGAGGGALSSELDLVVTDITNAGSPTTVYTGKIAALTPAALGTLAAGDSRTYEFRVLFPDTGPGAENAYQGSSMSVQFDWTATNDQDFDPPETSITTAPGALSASAAASFSFTASEAGSSFECSLDGAAFAACSSPKAYSGLADGGHTFSVRATDAAGNVDPSPAAHTWTVDTARPTLSSSSPADGSTVASAASLQLVASEDVAGVANATLDGVAAPAPTVAGSTVTYTTAFADGPHTLAGELEDLAGNRRPIRVHFTVWSLAAADYPFVEKNSFPSSSSALRSASDTTTVTMPAGAWSGAPAGDWLVFRIDPSPAAPVGNGFETASEILEVTAYWALAGTKVRDFDKAIAIEVDSSGSKVVPATLVGGSWRAIPAVPGSTLPSAWDDGFVRNGSNVRILTRHLSFFTLLRDVKAPNVPGRFKGTVKRGKYSLSWAAARDNSGLLSAYRVYANGAVVKKLGGSSRSAAMGSFRTSDARGFQVSAVDEAGNVGAKSVTLKIVPEIKRLKLASAKSALTKRGFKVGKVTYRRSSKVAAGEVISAGASGLRKKGAKISLTVSSGMPAPTQPDNSSATPSAPGVTPPPPAPAPYSYPYPTSAPPSTPPAPAPTATDATPDEGTPAPGTTLDRIQPEQRASEEQSPLRRFLGYALLPLVLAVGLGTGLHLRRGRMGAAATAVAGSEPIVLWDVRLVRLVRDTVRRLARRA